MKSLGCPQRVELKKFVVESVDDAVADRIESHLKVCSACAAAIDAIDAETYPQLASALEHDDLEEDSDRLTAFLGRLKHLSIRNSSSANSRSSRRPTLVDPIKHLGRYEIRECLRTSRMSEVYRAYDSTLDRDVALKVLPSHHRDDAESSLRFVREMKNAGRLHHTHIVPVLDAGEADGVCYYTMEFIVGADLGQVLRARGNDPRGTSSAEQQQSEDEEQAADVGAFAAQIADGIYKEAGGAGSKGKRDYYRSVAHIGWMAADALSYAHGLGILHRDVKPSNLLIDAQQILRLADFGLAKSNIDDHTLTGIDDVVGTPSYIPPEAFKGTSDPRGDVYALGITLYELLTGKPPYVASPCEQLILKILEGKPQRLESIDAAMPKNLATIVHKAMHVEPARRYETARAMADDLLHFVNDEPISARPESLRERAERIARRNPVATRVTLLFLAVLLVAAIGFAVAWRHSARLAAANGQLAERHHAERTRAETALAESQRQQAIATETMAHVKEIFDAASPYGDAESAWHGDLVTILGRLDPYQIENPIVRANCLQLQGHYLLQYGDYERAASLLEDAIALGRAEPDFSRGELLESTEELASLLTYLKRHHDARERMHEAVELSIDLHGFDGVETLRLRLEEAIRSPSRDNLGELIEEAVAVLGTDATGLSPLSSQQRNVLHTLAKAYRLTGQHEQDVQIYERLLDETPGEGDHRERIKALISLAGCLDAAGRTIEGTPYVDEALQLANQHLAPSDPARLWAMLTMVRCYTRSKRYEDARVLQANLVELGRARFGPDHPRVTQAVEKLRVLEELLSAQGAEDRAPR